MIQRHTGFLHAAGAPTADPNAIWCNSADVAALESAHAAMTAEREALQARLAAAEHYIRCVELFCAQIPEAQFLLNTWRALVQGDKS